MTFSTLHDAIIHSLEITGRPLSYQEIADYIESKSLWKRPSDGKFPQSKQIKDRAKYKIYKAWFNISRDGIVSLKPKPAKNELRIAQLTYNTNNWEFPSGYEGKSKTKSYEKSNGFGHEEWLLDLDKAIDGYHYGFLEPINKHCSKVHREHLRHPVVYG